MELEIHVERCRHGRKALTQYVERYAFFGNKADAHEEATGVQIVELGAIDDVATLAGKITRNRGNDTTGGLAGDGQDEIMHRTSSNFRRRKPGRPHREPNPRSGPGHARMRNALTGLRYQATLEERLSNFVPSRIPRSGMRTSIKDAGCDYDSGQPASGSHRPSPACWR